VGCFTELAKRQATEPQSTLRTDWLVDSNHQDPVLVGFQVLSDLSAMPAEPLPTLLTARFAVDGTNQDLVLQSFVVFRELVEMPTLLTDWVVVDATH
jgi:hypothetical protein